MLLLLLAALAVRAGDAGDDEAAEPGVDTVTVFHPHSGGGPAMGHRIPGLVYDRAHGVLLAFAEGRVTCNDYPAPHHPVMSRSTNQGRSWSNSSVIFNATRDFAGGAAWDPTPVFDERSGAVHVLFSDIA